MDTEIIQRKKEIRRSVRRKRDALSDTEVQNLSERISEHVVRLPEFQRADYLMCYMAFRNEVDCNNIMLTGVREGKQIYLPKVEGEEMSFYPLDLSEEERTVLTTVDLQEAKAVFRDLLKKMTGTRLVLSSYRIPEPVSGRAFQQEQQDRSFMVLPGLVYDRMGNRLGYGGGYYDRFLAVCHPAHVAVAYSFQIHDEILPCLETDIRPDRIITEQGELRRFV